MIHGLPKQHSNVYSFNSAFVSSCHRGVAIGGRAIVNCKNAVLSCLRSISNSVQYLAKPLFAASGKYNVSSNIASPVCEISPPSTSTWSIKDIPAERITQVCQAVILLMQNNHDCANGMFRTNLRKSEGEQLNADLATDPDFSTRINSGALIPSKVSAMSKQWCKQIMEGRLFTSAEAQSLIDNNTDAAFVRAALVKKMEPNGKQMSDEWQKLMAVFSLFNAYREICRHDGANEEGATLKYNEDTLALCVMPNFFDLGCDVQRSFDSSNNNLTISKVAFLSLLDACNKTYD